MSKELRPEFTTIVDPSEYDIDGQMEEWLEECNRNKAYVYPIDVGKMWGLYLAYKDMQEKLQDAKEVIEEFAVENPIGIGPQWKQAIINAINWMRDNKSS